MIVLTPHEIRVIRAATPGKPNKAIAFECNLTENTVKRYICVLYAKLKVNGRWGLDAWRSANGYASPVADSSYERARQLLVMHTFSLAQCRALVVLILDRCPAEAPAPMPIAA